MLEIKRSSHRLQSKILPMNPTDLLKMSGLAIAGLALCFQPANAAYTLVDDFESYTTGAFNGGSTAFTANGGPWEYNENGGGTGLVGISDDAGNQYVDFGWAFGFRGVQRTSPTIADGDSATYYWQVRSAGGGNTDYSSGLSYLGFDNAFGFGDFEIQIALLGNSGGLTLAARDGDALGPDTVTGLTVDTWYDIWVVVDNATDTYDAYWGTSGDPEVLGTKFADDYTFRNSAGGAQSADLVTFATLSNNQDPDRSAHADNIYFNTEAVPEPSVALLGGLGLLALVRRRR